MIVELRDWQSSVAGATYLILSSLGGVALLFGFVLIDVQTLSPGGLVTIPFVVAVMSVGIALQWGVAPVHYWLPNTFQRAGPVSAAVAAGVLGPATLGLLIQALSASPQLVVDERVNGYLTYGGLFTAVFGAVAALAPGRFRRRIGYSLVSDLGFVLVGMATYTRIGVAGAALHLVHRSLLALVLVGTAAEMERVERASDECGTPAPYLWGSCMLGALSLLALPPLSGFAGAWAVYQAVSLNDWHVALVLAAASVTCLAALLTGLGETRRESIRPWRRPRAVEVWLMALSAFTASWGFAPGLFLGAIHAAVRQLPFLKPF